MTVLKKGGAQPAIARPSARQKRRCRRTWRGFRIRRHPRRWQRTESGCQAKSREGGASVPGVAKRLANPASNVTAGTRRKCRRGPLYLHNLTKKHGTTGRNAIGRIRLFIEDFGRRVEYFGHFCTKSTLWAARYVGALAVGTRVKRHRRIANSRCHRVRENCGRYRTA